MSCEIKFIVHVVKMRTVQITGSHRVGEVEVSNVDGIISQCTEQFCCMSEHGFLITEIKLQVMIFFACHLFGGKNSFMALCMAIILFCQFNTTYIPVT